MVMFEPSNKSFSGVQSESDVSRTFCERFPILKSAMFFLRKGEGGLVDTTGKSLTAKSRFAADQFCSWAGHPDFVCVGANAAFKTGNFRMAVTDAEIGSSDASIAIGIACELFLKDLSSLKPPYRPLVILFGASPGYTDQEYSAAFWSAIQRTTNADASMYPATSEVDVDPESPRFGFSFCERGWFANFSTPSSKLLGRRSPVPALILNLQENFELLRKVGLFNSVRQKNADRQMQLQGFTNPFVADLGSSVDQTAQVTSVPRCCPFHRTLRKPETESDSA
jgi:uncharacterized protein